MGLDIKKIVKPEVISFKQMTGRILAVDAYNAIYQFLSTIRGYKGEYLADNQGRITSHLSGLFYRSVNLLELGVRMIYVFDGKPPTLKRTEIERRRANKEKAERHYEIALSKGDFAEARKYAQATSFIEGYMLEDSKNILDLLGIPWIEAPSEGEATAAYLTKMGIATDVSSQDFDSLLFGATRLVRNITISGRRKLPNKDIYIDIMPEEKELTHLLQELKIKYEQLIDLGILVGTDYNPDGFKDIGPLKALKYIRKYGCLEKIEDIQDELRKIDYLAIRDLFLKPEVIGLRDKLSWNQPNYEKILSFLCGERNFSEDKINKALDKIRKNKQEMSESLEKWF